MSLPAANSATALRNRARSSSGSPGRDREPQMVGQEVDHLARHLQVVHPPVEVDPVETLRIQTDVPIGISFTVTTRVATAHLRGRRQLNPPAWPHPTAASPADLTTTSAVRAKPHWFLVGIGYVGRPSSKGSSSKGFLVRGGSGAGQDMLISCVAAAYLSNPRGAERSRRPNLPQVLDLRRSGSGDLASESRQRVLAPVLISRNRSGRSLVLPFVCSVSGRTDRPRVEARPRRSVPPGRLAPRAHPLI